MKKSISIILAVVMAICFAVPSLAALSFTLILDDKSLYDSPVTMLKKGSNHTTVIDIKYTMPSADGSPLVLEASKGGTVSFSLVYNGSNLSIKGNESYVYYNITFTGSMSVSLDGSGSSMQLFTGNRLDTDDYSCDETTAVSKKADAVIEGYMPLNSTATFTGFTVKLTGSDTAPAKATVTALSVYVKKPVADFTVSKDGYITGINVTGGIMPSLTVPTVYNGKTVKGIDAGCTLTGSVDKLIIPVACDLVYKNGTNALGNIGAKTIEFGAGWTMIPDYVAQGNKYVTSIVLPSSVKTINIFAFSECSALKSVNLTNVTNIRKEAFSKTGLESVTLPAGLALSYSSTDTHSGIFSGCTSLKTVTVESGVTSIPPSCFNGCTKLGSIGIASTVSVIKENAFYGCTSLSSVSCDGTSIKTISEQAFSGCSKLTEFKCGNGASFPAVTSIGFAAFYGTGFMSISLPNTVTSLGEEAFEDCESLSSFSTGDGLTEIPIKCFLRCHKLSKITFGKNITKINPFAFANIAVDLSSNIDISLPENVSYIEANAFGAECLTSISIYNKEAHIDPLAFNGSSSFTLKGYPDSTTDLFVKTYGGTRITFASLTGSTSGGSTGTEKDYQYTIENGEAIIDTYIGSGNEDIIIPATLGNKPVTIIGANAFLRCSEIKNIILPKTIKIIRERAFANCTSLETVIIMDRCVAIDSTAFDAAPTSFVIKGISTSYAKSYADSNKITFTAITEKEYDCLCGTHGETKTEHKDPTCKEDGYDRIVCTVCGTVIKETIIPKLTEHKYEKVVTAPTCTEKGYTTYTCSICGESYVADEVAPAGHKWGEWVIVTKPTYTSTGLRERTCTVCKKEKQTETIPALTVDSLEQAIINEKLAVVEDEWDGESYKFIRGFTEKTSYEDIYTSFDSDFDVRIFDADGVEKASGYIATGDIIKLYGSDGVAVDTAQIVIMGDIDGDGKITATDYIRVRRQILKLTTLEPVAKAAADIDRNGRIVANDYIRLRKYLLKLTDEL